MNSGSVGIACACVIGLLAQEPASQQPRFSATADVVPLYVTVTSGQNRFAMDLTINDFTVLEDGRPRPISQFERGQQTLALAALIDESPSASDVRARTRAAAREIVRNLRPGDLADIGAFSSQTRLGPALTANVDELLGRVQALGPAGGGSAVWDAIDAGITAVDQARGRRVVVVLTDGVDNASFKTLPAVRERVVKSGVMLYVIGFSGSEGRPSRGFQDWARQTGGSYVALGGGNVEKAIRQVMDELHHQYLLGFSPAQLDGKVHKLEVRVSRRGLTAKSRSSYLAESR